MQMTKEIVLRLLLASSLLAPALAYAVVYEWVDPSTKTKYMEGDMPECYANPAPGCPRIKVYQDGHLIDDTGSKTRDAAAVHWATLEEREASLARLRSIRTESNRSAQQASADAKEAENKSYREKQRQVREDIKTKSEHFKATIDRITRP